MSVVENHSEGGATEFQPKVKRPPFSLEFR